MIRTFQTHDIRKQKELTNCLWEFSPCQGEHKDEIYHVVTPSCWETYPDFGAYRGEAVYSTHFFAEGNIRLEFKGVSHTATVCFDGKEIATHYNAYTVFSVIIPNVKKGEHTLEVKADNRFSKDSALHIPNDYMSYGGISRPVVLENISNVYIKQIHVTTKQIEVNEKKAWQAELEIEVENISDSKKEIVVKAELAEQSLDIGVLEIEPKSIATITKSVECFDVKEWDVLKPNLYYVKAYLMEEDQRIDDLVDRFGFREVKVAGTQIQINGTPIRIKGVCRHEDHPQFGCALPFHTIAQEIETVKHLGGNSIRTAHYPNDEVFLDLCDEEGILVWEENHARGLSLEDMQNPNFRTQALHVIQEMIPLHYNHPSIYIWGILNECASDTEYGKECYEEEFKLIKQLDKSRPHSFASCKFKTDICFGLPDVVSYNVYPLWYHDTPVEEYINDLYEWVQKETQGKDKPFLITEIGAGGIYGYRNSYHSKWTEEYQAQTLEKQVKGALNQKGCSGVYIWQLYDIRISEEWFGVRPRTMNNKGILDEYRRRKLSYDVVKNIFESIE